VRNIRRDGMDKLKRQEKDGEISKDEQRAWGDDLQKLTDGFTKEIDEALALKETEIMKV
jgi:ribosome recycling factor